MPRKKETLNGVRQGGWQGMMPLWPGIVLTVAPCLLLRQERKGGTPRVGRDEAFQGMPRASPPEFTVRPTGSL